MIEDENRELIEKEKSNNKDKVDSPLEDPNTPISNFSNFNFDVVADMNIHNYRNSPVHQKYHNKAINYKGEKFHISFILNNSNPISMIPYVFVKSLYHHGSWAYAYDSFYADDEFYKSSTYDRKRTCYWIAKIVQDQFNASLLDLKP